MDVNSYLKAINVKFLFVSEDAITHKEIGQRVLEKFVDECKDIATVEQNLKWKGANVHYVSACQ